jgi:Phosphopantetheine attachment site
MMTTGNLGYMQVELAVVGVVSAYLPHIDESCGANLFDLGLKSLDLTAICALVEKRLKVHLDVLDVIEEPSVEGISRVAFSKIETGAS